MSFILDALRKSDSERQQQAAPGLATTPQRISKPRQKFWVPLLIIVLILNVAVIAWIYLTDNGDSTQVSATVPTEEPRARSLRKEAESKKIPPPGETAPASKSAPMVEVPAITAAPAPSPPAATTIPVTPQGPGPATDTIQDALPSFQQLLVGGIISMPQLHLDIHVYASNPSKRFVFINMNKYHEGDRLNEGPVIEEITSYGAILAHQGNRFTLERD